MFLTKLLRKIINIIKTPQIKKKLRKNKQQTTKFKNEF